MPPRSHELYQSGLRANHEGRPIPACEWIQRAAVISGWPTLSVLLSLANMRLKLGQPSAALLAYRHILLVADPNGRHAHMARRKLQEALLLGGTDGSPSIPMRSPLSSLVASPNNGGAVGDDHLKQRGRSWLRWVEEQTPRAVARQSRRLRSPGNQNSPRATSKPGSHAASPYSRTYTNPTPSRPLLARMPTWRMGLGLSRPGDATLNEEQLSLLERLLLDSMLGGGSRSGPSELAHGGVRLQLGASLEEVELTLTAGQGKPASRSASLNSRLDTSLDSSNASLDGMDSLSTLGGVSAFDDAPIVRVRLRQLKIGWQKRARGGFRLRLGALPIDAYDLRRGGCFHCVGVVGARGQPEAPSSRPSSARSAQTRSPSPLRGTRPTFVQTHSWLRSLVAPSQQSQAGVGRSHTSPLPAPSGEPSSPVGPRRMFLWRSWRGDGSSVARGSAWKEAVHGRDASTIQRLVRGWLTRRGAKLLATLHKLRQFSTDWLVERRKYVVRPQAAAKGSMDSSPSSVDDLSTEWLLRIEKLPDGSAVHSDIHWVVPTPIEIVCDRILLDTLLDFFDSPHLAERAAQLAFMSELLLIRQPRRLHLALDIRAPRLIIPIDMRKDGPIVAVDMGHLTFARSSQPEHGSRRRRQPSRQWLRRCEQGLSKADGAAGVDAGMARRGSLDDLDYVLGAPSTAVTPLDGAPSPPRFRSSSSSLLHMNDFLYDTYEVRISNMQALLMQSSNEQLVPAQHAIVERFQLAIRYQRRRMPPTVGPLEDEFGHQQLRRPHTD